MEFEPSPFPYDPRDFLRGKIDYDGTRLRGFFDAGAWAVEATDRAPMATCGMISSVDIAP